MTRFLTRFRALFAAGALVLLLGGGVAFAAAQSAGAHGNASHQHTAAASHGAAGSTSQSSQSNQGNHGDSNNGRRDHGSSAQGAHPANHGEFVSRAAHDCAHGKGDVHGDCVSAVAKSSQGK